MNNKKDPSFGKSSINKVNQNVPSKIDWNILKKNLNKTTNHPKSLWGFVNDQQNNNKK